MFNSAWKCLAAGDLNKSQEMQVPKLDSKSKQYNFQGYSREEFGYRLWDIIDKKVIRGKDEVFLTH